MCPLPVRFTSCAFWQLLVFLCLPAYFSTCSVALLLCYIPFNPSRFIFFFFLKLETLFYRFLHIFMLALSLRSYYACASVFSISLHYENMPIQI